MKPVFELIKKDILLEWRQKHALYGALLYLTCTVFVLYMMAGQPEAVIWNVLFWVAQLFVTVNTIAKSFLQESEGRSRYYYTLVSPVQFVAAKMVYNLLLMMLMTLLALGLFRLLLGNPILDFGKFVAVALLGSAALSLLFTFLSAIAARARQNAAMMAIMGFPIAIPLLMILGRLSLSAVLEVVQEGWGMLALMMAVMSLLIFSLALVLFPVLWKT